MNLNEKVFSYDKYILSLTYKLRRNTLFMDEEDFLQFGREEVVRALNCYNPDKAKNASESYFVKKRLKWRFFNLFEASIGRTSSLGKTVLRRNKAHRLDFKAFEEKPSDFENIISNSFGSDGSLEDQIHLKHVLDKLLNNDEFNKNWNSYREYRDQIYQLNKDGKYRSDEYKDICKKLSKKILKAAQAVEGVKDVFTHQE